MPQGSNSNVRTILVAGDVTIDWNIACTRTSESRSPAWTAEDSTRAYWQRGGAALLADLIEAVANQMRKSDQAMYEIRPMAAPRNPVHPGDVRYHHSYAMWSLFKPGVQPPLDAAIPVWRVEGFLGLDRSPAPEPSAAADGQKMVNDPLDAELVVLDDADLGFRDHSKIWPKANTARWILLKMARPVAQGALWDRLHTTCADRLIVVMTVNDLRLTEVQISRELSWERTAQDVAWELVHKPRVNALSRCAHVVISFDTAGAVLLSRSPRGSQGLGDRVTPTCRLFFDPTVIEGMWGQQYPGGMIGYTSCLTAGIARQLMLSPDQPNLEQGIQRGLAAMRALHLEGYGVRGLRAPQANLKFPTDLIADELAKDEVPFAVAEIQDPIRFLARPPQAERAPADAAKSAEGGFWTILEDRYTDSLDQVAQQVALEGAEAVLRDVPLGQFGALLTVDRREIESFRSIRALVGEYCRQPRQKRPLSIAVSGAPGSGKSFGIIEVANSLLPGQIKALEFNLSQFSNPDALLQAFHQVRDVGLSGLIPLVFWDEFDTALTGSRLGWLRYFLAPMQDGGFQEGQLTHPIGRSIFVFAGGTSERMETFGEGLSPEEFRTAKGPDFVSRLKGYVNILGPNQQKPARPGAASADPYYLIRRAILLRSTLKRGAPQLFHQQDGKEVLHIDPGVLRAFLKTRMYKHSVRSMESLIAMSLLTGKTRFERSALPAEAQLDLHVNARDFVALVQQMELEGELLERLAQAAHQVYCAGKERDGWKYGSEKSEEKKTHPLLVPYDELPEIYKESNRVTVRTIPQKLAAAGYVMIPARSNERPLTFPGEDLEKLARFEHELWMADKLASGFTLGTPTPDDPKRNEYLVPWEKVPEEIKRIDRDLIQGISEILSRAGYTIVKIRDASTE
jgi:hypothetical protein